jgi:hypothetical protein
MDADWKKRLGQSPFRRREVPRGTKNEPALDAFIGLDYGTRFTKIAVGIGRQRKVWQDGRGKRLIPSIVYLAPDGTVITHPHQPPPGSEKIEYLKMLLVDGDDNVFRNLRPRINGRALKDVVRPMAAAFLSGLVRQVRSSVLRDRTELSGRRMNWFVNVGAPVQHCDAYLYAFKEVAAVAFYWERRTARRRQNWTT